MNALPNIDFYHNRMDIGGVEHALLRLTEAINKDKYEVRVCLQSNEGALQKEFSNQVSKSLLKSVGVRELLKNYGILECLKGIVYRIKIRTAKEAVQEAYWTSKCFQTSTYDCAISYSYSNLLLSSIVANSTARVKILWLHSRFRDNIINVDSYRRYILNKYDYIVCVSEEVKSHTLKIFPECAGRVIVIYNSIDSDKIHSLSEAPVDVAWPKLSIVTVARLAEIKGVQLIPEVCRIFAEEGRELDWYIIGEGPVRELLEKKIEDYKLSNLHLLGAKENPYPFMKACTIYVQPSIDEGFGFTVQEAKILTRPIVATDIGAFREQIKSDENGLLVPCTVAGLYEGVSKLLDSPAICDQFSENLKNMRIDSSFELEKLYTLINAIQ